MNPLVKLKHMIEFIFTPFYHQRGFFYNGKYYPYFFNMYNATWRFDRKFEIPIFKEEIEQYDGDDILEVGNTMKHYIYGNWDIIDKYEKGEGVINEDICTFTSKKKYGLIISISTLEHIGLYQYGKGDGESIVKAFSHILDLLKPEGRFVFSYTGGGYNPQLDEYIKSKNIKITTFPTGRKNPVCFGEVRK